MSKTLEEMAEEYCASPHEKDAFLAGYKAAKEEDTCEHILDMEKMVDVNGWISVKDRLPEVGISVLLIVAVADGGFVTSGWLSPQLQVFECAYGRVYWPEQITNWMPLPEPPKEE
jgi:hypothetical protein